MFKKGLKAGKSISDFAEYWAVLLIRMIYKTAVLTFFKIQVLIESTHNGFEGGKGHVQEGFESGKQYF